MEITREMLLQQIELEREVAEVLKTQAGADIYSTIDHAEVGWDASVARHAALQHLLDVMDQREGKGEP
jgi:hypothetical protein